MRMDVVVHAKCPCMWYLHNVYVCSKGSIEDWLRAALTRKPKILEMEHVLKNIYRVKYIPHTVHVFSTDSGMAIANGPTSDKAIMARIRVYVCASACMWYLAQRLSTYQTKHRPTWDEAASARGADTETAHDSSCV